MAGIIFLGLVVLAAFSFCVAAGIEKEWGFVVVFSICGIIAFAGMVCCIRDYNLPHHGIAPKLEDISKNEAYMDTTKIINNNDTIYEYHIKWNDVK